ncbi:DNA repair protein [Vibrio vulnificus]|uniref:TrlF family AAA-like ATPase n=1 Tax=Vibrio vulnificus TaxID=672 RepID=UPI000D3E4C8E|nr:DNA repair protein [Vibrio vulnificus]ELK8326362.1 DNA repair protein [Vibrio vulnificus]ELN6895090.1 DNA repair protein [Vibrio vulnificus]MBN8130063.1 DNA repair protein [Vibrio vulnificus]MBN8135053.1 DNA repair protein [Vibrio vulnificus]MBN8158140.1 DNA repair protein [Vibrio vulnificus]
MTGSIWNKWDLHIHSPFTHQNNQFGSASLDEYTHKLNEAGLSLVGITNYFYFADNELEEVRNAIRRNGFDIKVLGNLEFRISQPNKDSEFINIHCVFAEHLSTAQINSVMSKLKVKNTTLSYGAIYCEQANLQQHGVKVEEVMIDYAELEEHLSQNFKRGIDYLMVVCPNGYGGFRPDITEGRSLALAKEIDKFGDFVFGSTVKDREFFLSGRGSNLPPKPVFSCSDAHTMQSIGTQYSWVKARPTFEGLRQVLIEPEERVQIVDDFVERSFQKPHFKSITLNGTLFPNQPLQFKSATLPLNKNMVAIIGGRGTGKSILLDSIRSKFPNNPATLGLRTVDASGLAITLNQGDGSEIHFNQPENVYSYLHVSQGDIQHVSQKPDELSKEIKRMLGLSEVTFDQAQTQLIQDCLAKYRAYIDYRNTTDSQGNKINDENYQQNVINYNIELMKTLTNPQNQGLIEKYQRNIQSINQINQFIVLCQNSLNSIKQSIDPLNGSISIINGNALLTTQVPFVDYSATTSALQSNIERSQQNLAGLSKENESITEEFKKQGINQDISSLLNKVNECQTQIDVANNKLKEIEERNAQYFKLVSERTAFAQQYQHYLNCQKLEVDIAFSKLGQEQVAWNQEQNTLVKDILTDINIYGSQSFSLEAFYTGLLSRLNGGKFRGTASQTSLQKLQQTFNVHAIDDFFKLLKNEKIIVVPENTNPISLEDFCWQSDYFNQAGRFELLDYLYKPHRIQAYLHVNAEFNYKGKTVDKLSVGQRGTFYVCLKLATDPFGSPFIFDQPEDDLDNDFIMKQLVPLFRRIKKYRQVIIVTHNANLVVNSDAEQIIIANNESEVLSYNSGAVEDNFVRSRVCEILEGGGYAFEQRERKYGFNLQR